MRLPLFIILILSATSAIKAQPYYFPPTTGNIWDTMHPSSLNWCPERIDSLYNFLEEKNTKAFIILKDGKIVLEHYFGTFVQDSLWYWASAGKTLTATLVGIAQQDGALSIHDKTSDYLGTGWTSLSPAQEDSITIWHQLTMTSGLDDTQGDVHCTDPQCLNYLAPVGTRWAYHNGVYTLLQDVVSAATGTNYNLYTYQKLGSIIGMGGLWVKAGYISVFVSKARDMARFGLLVLNRGTWGQTPVLTDSAYFSQMVNTSQPLNLSYGYLWWLNGKASLMAPGLQLVIPSMLTPNAPHDMFSGLGKDDQKVHVVPSQNMVVIRLGEETGQPTIATSSFDNLLWQYINELDCGLIGIPDASGSASLKLWPNPANDQLHLNLPAHGSLSMYALDGRRVYHQAHSEGHVAMQVGHLPSGMYLCRWEGEGKMVFVKWMKVD